MIPLAVPNLSGNERKYLDDCIDTTFVSTVGEYVNRFEGMIAQNTGSAEAVATSAGTTGLHAALTAAGVKHGDLVILPSFTFIASANAIRHCGADPWLMDVSRTDWCLDPSAVLKRIQAECVRKYGNLIHEPSGKKVAALMPVYTLGNIPDMEAFRSISLEYQLPLIVDAACAIGAKYHDKDFGQLADLSVLSFNGNKTVTCGGGGAVVGASDKLLELVRHLTTTARVWPDYDFDMVGFNYRMTNVQAAIGCAQMERVESFVERKRYVRRVYEEALSDISDFTTFPTTAGASCWFSGIVTPEGYSFDKTKEIASRIREKGIDAKTFWKPIHHQKPYADVPMETLQVTDEIWERIITLPCSTGITDDELTQVIAAVRKICK